MGHGCLVVVTVRQGLGAEAGRVDGGHWGQLVDGFLREEPELGTARGIPRRSGAL